MVDVMEIIPSNFRTIHSELNTPWKTKNHLTKQKVLR